MPEEGICIGFRLSAHLRWLGLEERGPGVTSRAGSKSENCGVSINVLTHCSDSEASLIFQVLLRHVQGVEGIRWASGKGWPWVPPCHSWWSNQSLEGDLPRGSDSFQVHLSSWFLSPVCLDSFQFRNPSLFTLSSWHFPPVLSFPSIASDPVRPFSLVGDDYLVLKSFIY